jgi:hypothetical protein
MKRILPLSKALQGPLEVCSATSNISGQGDEMDQGQIEFRVFSEHEVVWFHGVGKIAYDYLMQQIAAVNADPDFRPTYNTFVDFGEATVTYKDGGFDRYMEFFKEHQHSAQPRRWAIYSSNPETVVNANMAHMFEMNRITVATFGDRGEALKWLSIPDPATL